MASSAGTQGPSPLPPGPGRPRSIVHLDMVGGWLEGCVVAWVVVAAALPGKVCLPAC